MKISVIIVSYNASLYIKRAIGSVLAQLDDSCECWVIDGGSTDGTLKILEEYDTSRFHYISEPDSGIYDAMNKGYKLANGEWILYLGADDLLNEGSLAMLNPYLNNNVDLIYGNYLVRYPSGQTKKITSLDYHCIPYKVFTNHQCVLMRKKVIAALNGFDERYRIVADSDLIQRCYLKGYKFLHVPTFVSVFSLTGISSNNYKTAIEWGRVCRNNKSIGFPMIAMLYAILRILKSKICCFFQ